MCSFLSGRKVVHALIGKCDLVAIGSVLHRKKENIWNRRIHVWGSGFRQAQKLHSSRHHLHAVRGKHSAALISNQLNIACGDPGLLIDQLLLSHQKQTRKKYRLGIVLHYKDRDHVSIANADIAKHKLIDVFQDPIEVAKQILQCEFVISSSLHGLVVADSLAIPNQWIMLSNKVRGAGWKFADYYSAFRLDQVSPLFLQPHMLTDDAVVRMIDSYQRPNLDRIKEQLTQTFPFPKP